MNDPAATQLVLPAAVPHVVEQFLLTELDCSTRLAYTGELGTDLWAFGARWGERRRPVAADP